MASWESQKLSAMISARSWFFRWIGTFGRAGTEQGTFTFVAGQGRSAGELLAGLLEPAQLG
jgi:hypothetical protein